MNRNEFMFLISQRGRKPCSPRCRTETLTSARSVPFSMSASARPSRIVISIARPFGTGNAPGWARQTGQVRVFSAAPYSSSQRQNIFVRVLRCACTSRPTTDSHSALLTELLLGLAKGLLDVVAHLNHRQPVLERAVRLDQPQLALAGLELELHVADEDGTRAVEHARMLAEDTLDGEHELGGGILEAVGHARSLSGTGSKPSACSTAWPIRKSVFSANCGPTSCRPTGNPSESPHGMLSPGRPAMQDGIVSRSLRYIAIGSAVRAPSGKATVGEVGETSASNRSKSASCSRLITVRTFWAWP